MLALLGIFLIIAITEHPKTTPMRIDTLGVYAVSITWPNGSNDDVDLWVQDPQGRIAWYGQRQAGLMNLQDDDLGTRHSGTDSKGHIVVKPNGERVVIKGSIPGEYTVNVHMYSKSDAHETRITCTLTRLRGADAVVVEKQVVLVRRGQEATCFRFTLDATGDYSNINTLPKQFVGMTPPPR
jgi:hypothetical protein